MAEFSVLLTHSFTDARAKPLLAPRGCAQPVAQRSMSSLPEHQLLGMPGLSPTMTVGNIVKYHVKVGDKLAAGDMICDIETDKATIGWESMEEGYVAALLVPEVPAPCPLHRPPAHQHPRSETPTTCTLHAPPMHLYLQRIRCGASHDHTKTRALSVQPKTGASPGPTPRPVLSSSFPPACSAF